MGSITVRLRNKANVCEAFLDDIFSKSELDNQELLLILDDKNGNGYGAYERRASATPSCVFDPYLFTSDNNAATNVTNTEEIFPCRDDIEWIDLKEWNEWDTVVYVPKITAVKWKDYKPYFAFVLAHELEHVKVIRENLKFNMFATWLFEDNENIFEKADIDYKSKDKWNFPLELQCNRKGKKLAISLFGKDEFDKCLKAMREDKNETKKHKDYLAFISDELEGQPYTKNTWQSVCRDIRGYYNDKLKTAAHEIWKDHKSEGNIVVQQFDINQFLPLV